MRRGGSNPLPFTIIAAPIGAKTPTTPIGGCAGIPRGGGERPELSILLLASRAGLLTFPARNPASRAAADRNRSIWQQLALYNRGPSRRRLNDPALCPAGNDVDLVAGNTLPNLV